MCACMLVWTCTCKEARGQLWVLLLRSCLPYFKAESLLSLDLTNEARSARQQTPSTALGLQLYTTKPRFNMFFVSINIITPIFPIHFPHMSFSLMSLPHLKFIIFFFDYLYIYIDIWYHYIYLYIQVCMCTNTYIQPDKSLYCCLYISDLKVDQWSLFSAF